MAERAKDFLLEKEMAYKIPGLPTHTIEKFLTEFASAELSLSSPIVPEVVEWEYKVISEEFSEFKLDEQGRKGWVMCGVVFKNGYSTFYFKRQKQKQ